MGVQQGKQINITDYRETYPEQWRNADRVPWKEYDGNNRGVIYVGAPSFVAYFEVSKRFFASITLYFTVSKWNGGNGFTTLYSDSVSFDGSLSLSWKTTRRTFGHNKDNESLNKYDNSDIHLWKLDLHSIANNNSNNAYAQLRIWTGGIEVVPQTEIHSHMWKTGSKLYASYGNFDWGSNYSSDLQFIEWNGPANFRGTPISVSTAKYAYSVKED